MHSLYRLCLAVTFLLGSYSLFFSNRKVCLFVLYLLGIFIYSASIYCVQCVRIGIVAGGQLSVVMELRTKT